MSPVSETRTKTLILLGGFGFLVVSFALFYTQLIMGHYYGRLAQNNRIRLLAIPGVRGDIYDRNGKPLATTRLSFDVSAIPQDLREGNRTLSRLSDFLRLEYTEVIRRYRKGYLSPYMPIVIARDVDKRTAMKLEENKFKFPGVMIEAKPIRVYPNGFVGSHFLGYLGEINRHELTKLRDYGYKIKDLVGRGGIEESYDSYLRGEDGGMELEVDSTGHTVRSLGMRDPIRGKDLVLSVDLRIQAIVDKLLAGRIGAFIILDPNTGEVLALQSSPNYDPNIFIDPNSDERVLDILRNKNKPLLNRAISGMYPPGSIFKPITATAALELRKISPNTRFDCAGSYTLGRGKFDCWKSEGGHGAQNLALGLINSCNVYFFRTGRAAGCDGISSYAKMFELGEKTNIDLPNEGKGLLPSRQWKRLTTGQPWYEGETLNLAIGQGYLMVTPLQMAKMISVFANGGKLIEPHLVKRVDNVAVSSQRLKSLNVSERTIGYIKDGLNRVAEDENGTAHRARVEGIRIAAKTGTAQAGKGETHAWFVGYAPQASPKIAFVVFLEHGGSGGMTPALMVKELIKELMEKKIL